MKHTKRIQEEYEGQLQWHNPTFTWVTRIGEEVTPEDNVKALEIIEHAEELTDEEFDGRLLVRRLTFQEGSSKADAHVLYLVKGKENDLMFDYAALLSESLRNSGHDYLGECTVFPAMYDDVKRDDMPHRKGWPFIAYPFPLSVNDRVRESEQYTPPADLHPGVKTILRFINEADPAPSRVTFIWEDGYEFLEDSELVRTPFSVWVNTDDFQLVYADEFVQLLTERVEEWERINKADDDRDMQILIDQHRYEGVHDGDGHITLDYNLDGTETGSFSGKGGLETL